MRHLILATALAVPLFAAAVHGAPMTPPAPPEFSPQQRTAFESLVDRMRATEDPAKRQQLLEGYRQSLATPTQPVAPSTQRPPAPPQWPATPATRTRPSGPVAPRGYPPPPPFANYGYGAMPYYPPPPYMGMPYSAPAQSATPVPNTRKERRRKHGKAVLKELRNISTLLERIAVALENGGQPSLGKPQP